ncbi:hypothetical protein E2C01_102429 [Portunus trituberculatus]|uniref:Uncharacterized protein n=1 Tax=Portunus trituberculatus TaxID=210409 RepID=A0A5B7KMT4_PORTR|nr:hypothetical protein [Portunus trituberculatus]
MTAPFPRGDLKVESEEKRQGEKEEDGGEDEYWKEKRKIRGELRQSTSRKEAEEGLELWNNGGEVVAITPPSDRSYWTDGRWRVSGGAELRGGALMSLTPTREVVMPRLIIGCNYNGDECDGRLQE